MNHERRLSFRPDGEARRNLKRHIERIDQLFDVPHSACCLVGEVNGKNMHEKCPGCSCSCHAAELAQLIEQADEIRTQRLGWCFWCNLPANHPVDEKAPEIYDIDSMTVGDWY